ncbi:hypothetical protein V3A08_07490 [Tenacibaculum maritimum]|uniref:hypothetical protein n=1 Tax=Tenacibaculum maritimum TaxID=107401 RepID=UPI003876D98F
MKILKTILSLFVILVFAACASTKHKFVKNSNIVKDTTIIKSDSIKITTINKSIDDLIFLPVETGNKKIDSVITKRLNNFKTYKKSGNNSYKITFNKLSKGFEISSKIGQSENTLVKKIDSLKKIKSKIIIKKKDVEIIRYRIPSWLLLIFLIVLIAIYILTKLKII